MAAIHEDPCAFVQGEVELISQMKPRGTDLSDTGLLEYLEEIIGSDTYVDSIKQLSEQLEAATSERDTMERRIRSVEQEADQLAQRKGDAERYLQQKANCIRLKIQRSAYTTFHLKVSKALSQSLYKDLANSCQLKTEDLKEKLDALHKEMAHSVPLSGELRDQMDRCKTESQSMEKKCQQLGKVLRHRNVSECIGFLSQELEVLGKEASDVECASVRLQAKQKHIETEKEKAAAKMLSLQEEIQVR